MRMAESLVTTKGKVEELLSKHPALRDSDKLLWLAYLNKFHDLRNQIGETAYITLRSVLMNDKTPTMESVRRVRQKLQEEGKHCGEKRKDRLREEGEVREWAKN